MTQFQIDGRGFVQGIAKWIKQKIYICSQKLKLSQSNDKNLVDSSHLGSVKKIFQKRVNKNYTF